MTDYSHSLQGKRDSNEDQHSIILNLNKNNKEMNDINFFGVYESPEYKNQKTDHFQIHFNNKRIFLNIGKIYNHAGDELSAFLYFYRY